MEITFREFLENCFNDIQFQYALDIIIAKIIILKGTKIGHFK